MRALSILLGLALAVLPAAGQAQADDLAQLRASSAAYGLPSDSMATALSAIGTAAAVAGIFSGSPWLALGGLAIGPSLGFLYGGCWGRGLLTAGFRFGATMALVAVAVADDDGVGEWGVSAWLVGMTGSAILDVATVGRAVRRQNQARLARRGLRVDLSPFAMPKGGGLQVRLSF
jgi:hypothetical protein